MGATILNDRLGDDVPRGILFMIASTLMFALTSATAKWLVAIYPVGEVMFIRSLTSLAVCSAFILPATGLSVFATQRLRDHFGRGLSQSISQTFTVLALGMMPLAGAMAISFSAPLWATLVAVIWLRERAGPVRIAALLAGFVGVLVITRPGSDSFQLGALFALANAVMYGSVTVAVRGMSKTESGPTLLMWQLVIVTGLHSVLLVFGFRMPTPGDAALLVLSGLANAAAQYFWTRALVLAPAPAVSPFYYLGLVWAIGIGFLVWGDVPTLALLLGSAIVLASALFLLWHEGRRRPIKAAKTLPPRPLIPAAAIKS
jgi:drug/metabolite transporter (DMT)-like permease